MVDIENFYYRLTDFGKTLSLKDDARRPFFFYPFSGQMTQANEIHYAIREEITNHTNWKGE